MSSMIKYGHADRTLAMVLTDLLVLICSSSTADDLLQDDCRACLFETTRWYGGMSIMRSSGGVLGQD